MKEMRGYECAFVVIWAESVCSANGSKVRVLTRCARLGVLGAMKQSGSAEEVRVPWDVCTAEFCRGRAMQVLKF